MPVPRIFGKRWLTTAMAGGKLKKHARLCGAENAAVIEQECLTPTRYQRRFLNLDRLLPQR